MANIENILGSEVLSEDVKNSINEAWDAKIAEVREELTAELREEFAVVMTTISLRSSKQWMQC